jgi:hypothetical protein
LAGFPRILFGKGLYGTEKVQAGVKQEKIQNADAGERGEKGLDRTVRTGTKCPT